MPPPGYSSVGITEETKRRLIRYKSELEKRESRIFSLSEVIESALDAAESANDTFAFLDTTRKASA
jgi:hypothetical protein